MVKHEEWDSEKQRPFKVIAFYTIGTPYEDEVEVLKLSLQERDYSYHICGVPSLGSWQKNTQYKSSFVHDMLDEYIDFPLLYLDVDCFIVQPLAFLESLQADIAAAHFPNKEKLSAELLSGTVYFGNTAICRSVVKRWCELNKLYPETLPDKRKAWDQRTLRMAVFENKECNFVELPAEYTWIVGMTEKQRPGLSPVIVHTRGAHRFSKAIK